MIPWFQWNTTQLGPVPIQVWGLMVALGMLLSIVIIWKRAGAYGFRREKMIDMATWMIVLGVIGARIFHIVFYEPVFYLQNPVDIFKIWHGGLSSYGGFVGALFGLWFIARKQKISKKKLWKVGDLLGFSALYGWIVGRIGCFFIHDHMGMPCDCFLAMNTPDGPRLEMALLEIITLLPLAIFFWFAKKKDKPDGWFVGVLFAYYGAVRFVLDFFRATDIAHADARYFGLTPAQHFSILMLAGGIFILSKIKKK